MERKDIKQFIKALIGVGVLLLLIIIVKPQNYIRIADNSPVEEKPLINGCPIFYTYSQHGDINLPVGTIFGYPAKSGENLYDIIRDDTFIMSAYFMESFKKDFRCFKTEEEAVVMGYKKFLSDQASRKKGRLEAEERLNKPWGERKNATDTAEVLRDIDAVIGL